MVIEDYYRLMTKIFKDSSKGHIVTLPMAGISEKRVAKLLNNLENMMCIYYNCEYAYYSEQTDFSYVEKVLLIDDNIWLEDQDGDLMEYAIRSWAKRHHKYEVVNNIGVNDIKVLIKGSEIIRRAKPIEARVVKVW